MCRVAMYPYFKVLLLLVTLAYVNCLPISEDQTIDAGSDVEASASGGEEIDNISDSYEGTDTGIEENGTHMLSLMYAHKNDIALLMKFIEDGFNLRGGMDKISSGIDAKKQGYKDIFYRGRLKSGLEKTILGDEMVVRGMRQGGKALFNLAVDNVYAVALNELRDSNMDGQFLLDMD